jgi:hypothetical protein
LKYVKLDLETIQFLGVKALERAVRAAEQVVISRISRAFEVGSPHLA